MIGLRSGIVAAGTENRGRSEHEGRTWRQGQINKVRGSVRRCSPVRNQEGPPGWRTRGNCDLESAGATWSQDGVTKGQEEVTRGRKDRKEVTKDEDLEDQEEAIETGPRRRWRRTRRK